MKVILWLILFLAANLLSQVVQSINGTVANGDVIQINGMEFGTKNPAAPLKWDNFENGIIGNDLENGWYTENRGGPNPKYANDVLRAGSLVSVKQDYTYGDQYNCLYGLVNQNVTKVYVTFYKYIVTTGGGCRNYKTIGLRGGTPGQWNEPEFRHDMYPELQGGHCYGARSDGTIVANSWTNGYQFPTGTWNRVEYYADLGDPNTANGSWYYWWDNELMNSWTNFVYRTTNSYWTNIYINGFFARDKNNAAAYIWTDDTYIDITRARVELGDNPVFANCKHREIQIPSAWSGSQIIITINQGSFRDGDNAYLFVVDQNGNVNKEGFPLVFGGSSDAPSRPVLTGIRP